MIFYYTTLHLSARNSSRAVSTKKNTNSNFQLLSTFVFLEYHKNVLTESCLSLKIYKYTKCHGPTLTGAISAYVTIV
jgi:hypothetical protein